MASQPWSLRCLLILAVLVAVSGSSSTSLEVLATYSGTTIGQPVYNRPIANGNSAPTLLSSTGTAVPYSSQAFYVTDAGLYTFVVTGPFDEYTFLYGGPFDPAQPFNNIIIGNDDLSGQTISSGFSTALVANSVYYLVTTGFYNSDSGPFIGTITGPSLAIFASTINVFGDPHINT
mmetsp:Transcript_38839/g.62907  ORF Transcript_38839/g.62907 Transcript_38839/m.62907 type:complete len:176 (-) Transcript_38839:58-585(-)